MYAGRAPSCRLIPFLAFAVSPPASSRLYRDTTRTCSVAPPPRIMVTRSGASYGLQQHLKGARLIGNDDSSRSGAFSMAQLEEALELYIQDTSSSKTQLRSEARGLGLNLVTGKIYGSAQRLSAALSNGDAPRAKLKQAKKYPLVKACLVLI